VDADPETTRSSLLGRLRDAGDQAAWREFDRRYQGLVVRYCLSRGLQIADAEDVRQSVMIGLSRTLKDFRYDARRGRFRSYLGRVVHNAVTRFQQTRRHEVQFEDLDRAAQASVAEDDQWIREWRLHHLRLALQAVRDAVEPESFAVFQKLLDGRETADVARELGMTEAAVHKVKQRMRDRLKSIVAEQIRDEDAGPAQEPAAQSP
jgi:RNA polymerase sigma-70 factor (ECF subfamily)